MKLQTSTAALALVSLLALSSCATAPTPAQEGNANTNIITITNVNENSATVVQNMNINGTDAVSSKKVPLTAQRTAPEGCSWEEAIFSQIRFLKYKCQNEPFPFSERNGNIYGSDSSTPVIEMFTKNSGETNEAAVRRVAVAGGAKVGTCEIVKSQQQRMGADRYEVAVPQAIQDKFRAENPDAPWWDAGDCGTYGQTNGIQYFEFQPNQERFFFIRIGQDNPGIDADGIEIGMNN